MLISARDYFQRISGDVNYLTNSERTACVLYASSSSLAKMSSESFSEEQVLFDSEDELANADPLASEEEQVRYARQFAREQEEENEFTRHFSREVVVGLC